MNVLTMPVAKRVVAALVVTAMALPVAGCSPTAPTPPGPSGAAASAAELAVTADVYRSRIDPSRGGIQLAVRNDADAPLTIVAAALESPALSRPAVLERTILIGAGLTRDLAITLTPAECPASTTDPPEAVLTVALADGTTTEVRVPTTDRIGQWTAWLTAECFAAAVAERASFSVQHDAAADSGALIGLRFTADRLDAGLELVALNDTVLFGLVRESDGARATSIPLTLDTEGVGDAGVGDAGVGDAGTETGVSIPVLLTPARCDPHALAEDKQGTLFVIDVVLDGTAGTVTIVADPQTRAALYDAYTRACAL